MEYFYIPSTNKICEVHCQKNTYHIHIVPDNRHLYDRLVGILPHATYTLASHTSSYSVCNNTIHMAFADLMVLENLLCKIYYQLYNHRCLDVPTLLILIQHVLLALQELKNMKYFKYFSHTPHI